MSPVPFDPSIIAFHYDPACLSSTVFADSAVLLSVHLSPLKLLQISCAFSRKTCHFIYIYIT